MPDPTSASIDFAAVWESSPDALILADEDGVILSVNGRVREILGWEPTDLVGQPVEVLVPDALRDLHLTHRDHYRAEPESRPMAAGRYLPARRCDGSTFPAQISLIAQVVKGRDAVLAAVRDASPWVAAEQKLLEADRRRSVAEDRERIARDLHDTVIQELFGVGMGLQSMVPRMEDPVLTERLSEAIDALDDVIREIRTTIFGLQQSPPGASLLAAVEDTVAGLSNLLGFRPEVRVIGTVDGAVADEIAGHILPTLREALTNVAKHAAATRAEVVLGVDDWLRLEVVDDGRGLPTPIERQGGLGNMARRAALLGGRFVVEPADPVGTRLTWAVPLGADAANPPE